MEGREGERNGAFNNTPNTALSDFPENANNVVVSNKNRFTTNARE